MIARVFFFPPFFSLVFVSPSFFLSFSFLFFPEAVGNIILSLHRNLQEIQTSLAGACLDTEVVGSGGCRGHPMEAEEE